MTPSVITVGPPVSSAHGAVSYIIVGSRRSCIIVDPWNNEAIERKLRVHKLRPQLVVITHEHFDHIKGTEYIRSRFSAPVLASVRSSVRLKRPKDNLSAYFHDIEPIQVSRADFEVSEDLEDIFLGLEFELLMTPGHTSGSLTLRVGENFFVGDTVLPHGKPVTNLPTGDLVDWQRSIVKLSHRIQPNSLIFPGHGNVMRAREHPIFGEIGVAFGQE